MLRIAIVGSGFGSYGLLPAFRSVRGCEVVALCGRKREQLMTYCDKISFTNLYADWHSMLENEILDAVALAVTPEAQYEIAKAAIAKGLHVFAEKPLTATLVQARELVKLAEHKKIIHGIDFQFPEIAEWKKTKAMLENGKVGKLQHIAVNWDFLSYGIRNKQTSWKTDADAGGGALAFYFSHGLHYLEHFGGAIRNLRCLFTHDNEHTDFGETGADLLLEFENGVTGTAHVCCNSRGLTRHQLIFYCEKGVIVLENGKGIVDGFTVTVHATNGSRKISVTKDNGRRGEDERVKIVQKLAKRFIDSCTAHKPMIPSFHEGLRVEELIAMARSNALAAE